MKTSDQCRKLLHGYASTKRAKASQRFFKTGPGQYGEGDVFIGVSMPDLRKVAKQSRDLAISEVQKLVDSPVHEERMTGLVILTLKFERAGEQQRQEIYEMYMTNVYKGNINNWDLVDVTTPRIIGEYLRNKPHDKLYELARSEDLWQKRAAILATFAFIYNGESKTTLELAHILLHDEHDLIQKAVGWMLREVGKRVDETALTDFLDKHADVMPRTMLRYAIERLTPEQRAHFMNRRVG